MGIIIVTIIMLMIMIMGMMIMAIKMMIMAIIIITTGMMRMMTLLEGMKMMIIFCRHTFQQAFVSFPFSPAARYRFLHLPSHCQAEAKVHCTLGAGVAHGFSSSTKLDRVSSV